jgi:hypothetical protein
MDEYNKIVQPVTRLAAAADGSNSLRARTRSPVPGVKVAQRRCK